jgi:iron(III) transport system substrate-binding protein
MSVSGDNVFDYLIEGARVTAVDFNGAQIALTEVKAAAVKFLDYLASDESQAIFAGANHEFPAVVGAPSPPDVVAISQFKADPMAVTIYGERQAQAQSVYDQAGWR